MLVLFGLLSNFRAPLHAYASLVSVQIDTSLSLGKDVPCKVMWCSLTWD